MRSLVLPVLVLAAAVAGGCGDDVPDLPVQRDTPAVTAPGTDRAYEQGGADGSGADGSEKRNRRGGVAAGPDIPGPNQGPRGESDEPEVGAGGE